MIQLLILVKLDHHINENYKSDWVVQVEEVIGVRPGKRLSAKSGRLTASEGGQGVALESGDWEGN